MRFTSTITSAAVAVLAVAALSACKPAGTDNPASAPSESVPAETAPSVDTAAPVTGPWAGLQNHIGKYPNESGLLTNSPIVEPLKTLLGDKYDTFVTNLGVQSPLTRDGDLLFTSGNKPHEGGMEGAYLILDPSKTTLEAGLWEKGKLTTYTSQGASLRKPADIQTMIQNNAG